MLAVNLRKPKMFQNQDDETLLERAGHGLKEISIPHKIGNIGKFGMKDVLGNNHNLRLDDHANCKF